MTGTQGKFTNDGKEINQNAKYIKSSIPISLTRDQYEKAKTFAEKPGKDWEKYDLNDRNCVDFVNETMNQAGVKGDVEDHLTGEQKRQMSGATVYVRYKYGDGKSNTDRVTDRPGMAKEKPSSRAVPQKPAQDGVGSKALTGDSGNDALGSEKSAKETHSPEIHSFLNDLKQPADPVSEILSKDSRTWTEDEVNQVHKSDIYQRAFSPGREEAFKKVRGWYEHHYGNDPVETSDTGEAVQAGYKVQPNQEPVPASGKDGKPELDGVSGAGSKIAELAGKRGLATAIKGAQVGLNMLDKYQANQNRAKTSQLKTDGVFGPKTKGALQNHITHQGKEPVENALALGSFKNLIDHKSGQAKGDLGEVAHDSFSSLFQKPSNFKSKDTDAKPWALAIQDTVNDIGKDRFGNTFKPIREDGWIGPKTALAFNRVYKPAGTDQFMSRLARNLGFV